MSFSRRPAGGARKGASSTRVPSPFRNSDYLQPHERGGVAKSGGGRPTSSRGGRGGAARTGAKTGGGRGGLVKQYIDPKRFVQKAVVAEKIEYVPTHKFEDFDVHSLIKANVVAKGYTAPTPIQDLCIPHALEGKDVVGMAATGTGKTAAFAIPLINQLMKNMDRRALILAPTRELAQQIMEELLDFSKGCSLRGALLIGGASMNNQTRDLRRNPRIVVGTPGRVKDHVGQGTLMLKFFNFAVLDEVDRMLDMGFLPDVSSLLGGLNKDRQSLFFSATMEKRIENLIQGFAKDPVRVEVPGRAAADGVDQNVVRYSGTSDKLEKLHSVLIAPGCSKTIIFDDTKRAVERLGKELHARGFKVDHIHGDKSQAQRARAIKRLKDNEIDVLVATDVAARGIDVSDVSHVVNYSTPNSYEDYVHRIGRTGRAGKTGCALTFLPA